MELNCPICENAIEIAEPAAPGKRVTCLHCFAQKDASRRRVLQVVSTRPGLNFRLTAGLI